jgi:putative nucleotidyltransferase with HDIG domain
MTRLSKGGRLYVASVIACGALVVGNSLVELWNSPVNVRWFVLAALTLLSGSFTIRIPTIPALLSVSETFVFAAVLLHGPAAATAIVVLDTLIISLWLRTRFRSGARVLFNVAAPSLAIWIAAQLFYAWAGIQPLSIAKQPILSLVPQLLALAVCYFLLNSILVAGAVSYETGTPAFTVWRKNFLWLSLNYFSGASVAALLLPFLQSPGSEFIRIVGIILPLLLISYLTFKTALGRVEDATSHLTELNKLYLSTIETLAMAIDAKDQITHGHIRRVQTYAVALAREMGVTDENMIKAVEAAALLHDMGKLAVPEYILNKPGPLTPSEFEKMKLHASVGADILSAIDFPYPVVPIVRHHHENWNGTGYPAGLAGPEIPIGARILSVVDCFDALTSDRPYRPKLSDKDALRILAERRGTMYDPLVVDSFNRIHDYLVNLVPTDAPATSLHTIKESSKNETARQERFEQIAASRSESVALFQLAQELAGLKDAQDIADIALRHLRSFIPATLAAVYLIDRTRDELTAVRAVGDNSGLLVDLRITLGRNLTGWVAANRQSIRNSDAMLDLGEAARNLSPRLRSCLAVPIVHREDCIGVIAFYSSGTNAFSEDHQRLAEAVAQQTAEVIASTQAATQPSSRVQSKPTEGAFGILYIRVRDQGDELQQASTLLAEAEKYLKQNIGSEDSIERPSTQELVVVVKGSQSDTAQIAAARLQGRLEALLDKRPSQDRRLIYVALSHTPDMGLGAETAIRIARLRFEATETSRDESPPGSIH